VTHLIGLVEDLLDVSRITQNKLLLRRSRFTVRAVVDAAVVTVKPLMDGAKPELRVEVPEDDLWLDADFTRITQVLVNLLENACKYTRTGGTILLSAAAVPGAVRIRIEDNGIGIDGDMLPRVFDMFAQASVHQRRGGGLGIGLTLVRQLVERHAGTVLAHSDGPGKGSQFTVILPIVAEMPLAEKPPAAVRPAAPRRILVVDDNRDITETVSEVLQMIGHQTRTAHDGHAALAAAAEFTPDLVLLDLGLPEMSGHEVARKLRELPGGRELTIIALTGWGEHGDATRAREAGFDGHLVKPAGIDTLRELVGDASAAPAAGKP
jgi:CheY-like chemotaxis protein